MRSLIMVYTLTALLVFFPLSKSYAQDQLSINIEGQADPPLEIVGDGIYRKFGFSIYHATLWAPDGVWDSNKPYALELRYMRDLSKDTLVDSIIDNVRDQDIASDEKLELWEADLNKYIPPVEEDDIMIGVSEPDGGATFYFNGKVVSKINDTVFARAFFNIWFGKNADKDLQAELLGKISD